MCFGRGSSGGRPTFAEKLHNCFRPLLADSGVREGEAEPLEQELVEGAHLADLKGKVIATTKLNPALSYISKSSETAAIRDPVPA